MFSVHSNNVWCLVGVQVVLCGAFYPNYFRWGIGDEEVNRRLFCGHNHCTTIMVSSGYYSVYYSGYPQYIQYSQYTENYCFVYQPFVMFFCLSPPPPSQLAGLPPNGPKYAAEICHLFSDCVDPGADPRGKALHFDGSKYIHHTLSSISVVYSVIFSYCEVRLLCAKRLAEFMHILPPPPPPPTLSLPYIPSSRVFVEFEQKQQRGRQAVLDSVLLALKKRRMREPLALYTPENISETMTLA